MPLPSRTRTRISRRTAPASDGIRACAPSFADDFRVRRRSGSLSRSASSRARASPWRSRGSPTTSARETAARTLWTSLVGGALAASRSERRSAAMAILTHAGRPALPGPRDARRGADAVVFEASRLGTALRRQRRRRVRAELPDEDRGGPRAAGPLARPRHRDDLQLPERPHRDGHRVLRRPRRHRVPPVAQPPRPIPRGHRRLRRSRSPSP